MSRLICLIIASLFVEVVLAKGNHNSKQRDVAIDSIVLHAIAGPYCEGSKVKYSSAKDDLQFWKSFFERHKVVGIHYIIDRNGEVISSIDDDKIANHAIGWNRRSIGIELINKGDGIDPFPELQMLSLQLLINQLMIKHPSIKKSNIYRHSDIDKRYFKCGGKSIKRKQDPGVLFDFQRVLDGVFK